MKQYGVGDRIWKQILTTCFQFKEVQRVILYGSRARGDYIEGSDIDLAIDAPELTSKAFALLWNALDNLPIIYSLDVVHLQALTNLKLLDAIKHEGVSLSR